MLSSRCSRGFKATLAMVLFALLATGCSHGGEQVLTGDEPGADGGQSGRQPGGGENRLFVSVEVGGGLTLAGHDFRSPPRSVVYDDGSTFSQGVVLAIYPGPAVLPVTEGQLEDGQVEEILEAAVESGLDGDGQRQYGQPPIADAPTTTITVVVDGEEHVTSIYALDETGNAGRGPGPGEPPGGQQDGPPGIGPEEQQRRDEARQFLDLVSRLVTDAEQGQYEPERYRVLPLEYQPEPDEGVEPQNRQWPFDDIALTARQCAAVTGEDAAEFRTMLRDATEITRWHTESGETFRLAIRPVLPHEPDCPEEG